MAPIERGPHFARQRVLRLRVAPRNDGPASLILRLADENLAQALIVAKEVGAITKAMALQESLVILLGALLDAKQRSLDVILVQFRRLDADEQGIAALRQQLA